jgi:hypothetical protein
MLIHVDLENIPDIPVRFGVKDMIPTAANVRFHLTASGLEFGCIDLSGWIVLKSGGPSKQTSSTTYWGFQAAPEPVQDIITYAAGLLTEMLK